MTNAAVKLEELRKEVLKCNKCSLCSERNKTVFSDGCDCAPIMFIGEAPGKNEDEVGIPFIGRAGQLLRKYLFETGFKADDFYIANTIKCRPPQNRKPTKEEKEACRMFLEKQIEYVKPKIIVLVGATALESFIDDKKLTISQARGKVFEKDNFKFFPIFHPSYLLRYHSEEEGQPRYLFRKDLANIKKMIN